MANNVSSVEISRDQDISGLDASAFISLNGINRYKRDRDAVNKECQTHACISAAQGACRMIVEIVRVHTKLVHESSKRNDRRLKSGGRWAA